MPTVTEENEIARAEVLARIRERSRIFLETFGPPEKPTRHGGIILDALRTKFGTGLPPNVLDDHGRTDALQTWRHLGHFDVLEYINQQLTWKEPANVNASSSRPE